MVNISLSGPLQKRNPPGLQLTKIVKLCKALISCSYILDWFIFGHSNVFVNIFYTA
jgi:hypothetical protein